MYWELYLKFNIYLIVNLFNFDIFFYLDKVYFGFFIWLVVGELCGGEDERCSFICIFEL